MTERKNERLQKHLENLLYWEMDEKQRGVGKTKRTTQKMPKEYTEVALRFFNFVKARHHSFGTQVQRIKALRSLWDFCSRKGRRTFSSITREDVNEFMGNLEVMENTYNSYVASFNVFFRWFHNLKKDEKPEQTQDLEYRKEKQKENPPILTPEDIRKMAENSKDQMHKALIILTYETGARIGEILNMNVGDVVEEEGRVKVRLSGKTGDRHPAIKDAVPDLKLWLQQHPFANDPNAPLFLAHPSRKDRVRMIENSTGAYFSRLGKRVLGKKSNPHWFRHSQVTNLARKIPVQVLNIRQGWVNDSKTAFRYMKLTERDADDAYLEFRGEIIERPKMENVLKPKICPICKKENSALLEYCHFCGNPLDEKRIREAEMEKEFQKFVWERLKINEQYNRGQISKDEYENKLKELEKETGITLV